MISMQSYRLQTTARFGGASAVGMKTVSAAKCSHFYTGQRLITPAASSFTSVHPGLHNKNRRSRTLTAPIKASFFGVGAPEALLVGVVALVLFGPKGLASAAKSLGATLKAFAPTIRELTQVSTELKSTLEEEIGLNDLREELNRPLVPTPRPAKASSTVDESTKSAEAEESLTELRSDMMQVDDTLAKAVDPEIERRREEAAKMAWGGAAPSSAAEPAPLSNMSIEELERELARRKASSSQE